ncbi:trimeric LpxA-like protein [Bisporella sp. PMI_857]|nr:trimeric LpxA-like protein [Bisporella sp. PMI_857]KAH8600299.1 trimeric LpxA-like protein [Bisporella sp. PMI_857]
MSTSKRASTVPSAPKPPTSLSSSVIIADNASLTGVYPIKIGSNTVIHPRSRLSSAYAPISIGSNCIISERSMIGYQSAPVSARDGLLIDDSVVIEAGAIVEARSVGEGCVIDVNARVGKGAVLGKHCKVGAVCAVGEGETLPDFTVIYGNGLRRVDKANVEELKLRMVGRQVEVLRKLIPSNPAKFQ